YGLSMSNCSNAPSAHPDLFWTAVIRHITYTTATNAGSRAYIMSNKNKRGSPLVRSVLALDSYLSDLERVGTKINGTDMGCDFDGEYIQKLMTRFTECGKGISEEVTNLSTQLREAQARAEAV